MAKKITILDYVANELNKLKVKYQLKTYNQTILFLLNEFQKCKGAVNNGEKKRDI